MKGPSSNNVQVKATCMRPFTVTLSLIARLKPPYRTPVHLHYIDKQSYTKIAQRLKLPKGTVKSYISRGIKILWKHILSERETSCDGDDAEQAPAKWVISTLLVNALPEPYRTVVHLHYMEHLSYALIAEQRELPEGTVKSQISRGMKLLRAMCSQDTPEHGTNTTHDPL